MKYYQIGLDVESNGLKNNINQVDINRKEIHKNDAYKEFINFFSIKNIDFWYNQDKIKDIKIPSIQAKLIKKAKLTDMMGYTENIPFLSNVYSEKYINILKAFNIGDYITFEVVIENVIEKYYMLFVKTILSEEINYERSIVITGHKALNDVKHYKVKNRQEYREFKLQNPLGSFEKISISKEHFGKDIIDIQVTSRPFYSERLIDFLLDCGITGFIVRYKNSIELDFY